MKKHEDHEEYNFWQPATDMMTGLVFVLLLVIVLLSFQLLYAPKKKETAQVLNTVSENMSTVSTVTPTATPTPTPEENEGSGSTDSTASRAEENAGGGGGHDSDPDATTDSDPGIYPEDGTKSAVRVQIVDAETGNAIKQEGVEFELYAAQGALEVLNTYYPEKISYRKYETTEDGSFFLPEKILEGNYYFRDLTAPAGYDIADNAHFSLDTVYDWPDPYMLRIKMSPSRNVISLHAVDADTGTALKSARFTIVAAEDIATVEGTVRYEKGTTVETLTTDGEGRAKSEELYLGKYLITQDTALEYYASLEDSVSAEVKKQGESVAGAREIKLEKTSVKLHLLDELDGTGIADGTFTLASDGSDQTRKITTDSSGEADISDLMHNTTYTLTQTGTDGNHELTGKDQTIVVASDGRISGKSSSSLKITNRMLRAEIGVRDRIFNSYTSGYVLTLYSGDGEKVDSWTTEASPREIDGLRKGKYYILIDENPELRTDIEVADTAQIQQFAISVMTRTSYLMIGLVSAGILAAVILLFWVIRRHRRKKKASKDAAPEDPTK